MHEKISEIKKLIHSDMRLARSRAERLFNLLPKKGSEKDKAEVYHLLALIEFYDNKPKDSINWYSKELKLREKLKDRKGASDVLNNLGAILYNQGKLNEANSYYQKALVYREAIGDKRGIAGVNDNIGTILFRSGRTAEAFGRHSNALKINRELGDAERISISLQNIGLTYLSQEEFTHALSNFQEALDIALTEGDKIRSIQLMINIGSTLIRQKNIVEAKKYFIRCNEESAAINYHFGLILSLQSLAYIEQGKGHHQKAIKYYLDCIPISETTGHTAEMTTALLGIGQSYAAMGDHKEALRYLLDALRLAKKTGIKQSISDIYFRLSDVYEQTKDFKKSLDYYKKHITIRDEIVNKETTKTISEIKTRYEIEQKEKEALLLKEKNDAVQRYAHKLEVSNNELKQFAHVASHDLREPLRMVSSYIGLLERTMGDNVSADQKLFIDFAVDGARRMDTLIHDLLRLAKVDADPRIEKVPLNVVIDEVKNNIEILLKEKHARIIAPELPAIMADRTQVMQLLQNIIGNGIKYNENPKPTIAISYRLNETEMLLSIADNGIGIPEEYRERAFQIFQRLPTDKKYQGSGIGLAICKKITDGLGGDINIADNEGGGTVFNISIPLSIVC